MSWWKRVFGAVSMVDRQFKRFEGTPVGLPVGLLVGLLKLIGLALLAVVVCWIIGKFFWIIAIVIPVPLIALAFLAVVVWWTIRKRRKRNAPALDVRNQVAAKDVVRLLKLIGLALLAVVVGWNIFKSFWIMGKFVNPVPLIALALLAVAVLVGWIVGKRRKRKGPILNVGNQVAAEGGPAKMQPPSDSSVPTGLKAHQVPGVGSAPSSESQIEEIANQVMRADGIGVDDLLKLQERTAKLVQCGTSAAPIIRKVLLSTRMTTPAFHFSNAATLCRVLGEIGGPVAKETLEFLARADSEVGEFYRVKGAAKEALQVLAATGVNSADRSSKSVTPPSDVIGDLLSIQQRISDIARQHPTKVDLGGPGATTVKEQIPILCANLRDAVRAMQTGVDSKNRPVTRADIAAGLGRLIAHVSQREWRGMAGLALDLDHFQEFLSELERLDDLAKRIVSPPDQFLTPSCPAPEPSPSSKTTAPQAAEASAQKVEAKAQETGAISESDTEALARQIMGNDGITIGDRIRQKDLIQKLTACGSPAAPIIKKVLFGTRLSNTTDFHNAADLCHVLGAIGGPVAKDTLEFLARADSSVAEFSIVCQAAAEGLRTDKETPSSSVPTGTDPAQLSEDRAKEIIAAAMKGEALANSKDEVLALYASKHGFTLQRLWAVVQNMGQHPSESYAILIPLLVADYARVADNSIPQRQFGPAVGRVMRRLPSCKKVAQALLDLYPRERPSANLQATIIGALAEIGDHRVRPLIDAWLALEKPGGGKITSVYRTVLDEALAKLRNF